MAAGEIFSGRANPPAESSLRVSDAQHLTASSMCKGAKNGVQFAPLIDHLARSAAP